jgi:hypothetical protein
VVATRIEFGPMSAVLVNDPEIVEAICVTQNRQFEKERIAGAGPLPSGRRARPSRRRSQAWERPPGTARFGRGRCELLAPRTGVISDRSQGARAHPASTPDKGVPDAARRLRPSASIDLACAPTAAVAAAADESVTESGPSLARRMLHAGPLRRTET